MYLSHRDQKGAVSTQTAIIGGIALILVIAAIAYMWPMSSWTPEAAYDTSSETWMATSSTSDEAAAIQAELEATNMSDFEASMNADAEASASGI